MRDSLIKKKIPHFCSLEDTSTGHNMEETNFWTKNEETDKYVKIEASEMSGNFFFIHTTVYQMVNTFCACSCRFYAEVYVIHGHIYVFMFIPKERNHLKSYSYHYASKHLIYI